MFDIDIGVGFYDMIRGGAFLERTKKKKPNSMITNADLILECVINCLDI